VSGGRVIIPVPCSFLLFYKKETNRWICKKGRGLFSILPSPPQPQPCILSQIEGAGIDMRKIKLKAIESLNKEIDRNFTLAAIKELVEQVISEAEGKS